MSGLKLFHASDLHFNTGYFDYILALQDKFDIFCFSGDFLYKENAQEKEQTTFWLKSFKKPVFVTDYPKDIKAFYMKLNKDGKTVRAVDLLAPGIGEIVGGSQREDDYDVLLGKIHEMGLKEEDYWWYLDLRKYGSVPHSGFGLGFDRMLMYITGMTNIRDVIPFPRTTKNLEF